MHIVLRQPSCSPRLSRMSFFAKNLKTWPKPSYVWPNRQSAMHKCLSRKHSLLAKQRIEKFQKGPLSGEVDGTQRALSFGGKGARVHVLWFLLGSSPPVRCRGFFCWVPSAGDG